MPSLQVPNAALEVSFSFPTVLFNGFLSGFVKVIFISLAFH
jgi:hypothetical protein